MSDQQTTRPDTAQISASGPVDGMGDPDPAGSYVRVAIETRESQTFHRISRDAAEGLIAELQGVLAQCPKGCPKGFCSFVSECAYDD